MIQSLRTAFLFILCTIAVASAAQEKAVVTASGFVKVYKAPSRGSSVIAFAKTNESYDVLWQGSDWVRIQFVEVEGWIQKNNVKFISASAAPTVKPIPQTTPQPQRDKTVPPPSGITPRVAQPLPVPPSPSAPQNTTTRKSVRARTVPPSPRLEPTPPKAAPRTTPKTVKKRVPQRSRQTAATQQNRRSTAPEPATAPDTYSVREMEQPVAATIDTIWVKIVTPTAPVRQGPGENAAGIGNAFLDDEYALLSQQEEWFHIVYLDTVGWIPKHTAKIVRLGERPTTPWSQPLFIAIGVMSLAIVALLIWIVWGYVAYHRMARHRVLMVSKGNKRIVDAHTNAISTVAKSLRHAHFLVLRAKNARAIKKRLRRRPPDILLVDWRFHHNVGRALKSLLTSNPDTQSIPVIFYNVGNVEKAQEELGEKSFLFLGKSFGIRDLLRFVILVAKDKDNRVAANKDVQNYALEGPIEEGSLSEVFQLIEVGNKTGGLLIDRVDLFGAIYFTNGIITYAACKTCLNNAQTAIETLLDLKDGYFKLAADAHVAHSNCSIRITAALMEWARKRDEAGKN